MAKNSASVSTQDGAEDFDGMDDDDDEPETAVENGGSKRGRKAEPEDMTPEERFRSRGNAIFVVVRQKLAAAKKLAGRDNIAYTDAQVAKVYDVIKADLDAWREVMTARELVASDDLDIL